jgi:hypothetical protein
MTLAPASGTPLASYTTPLMREVVTPWASSVAAPRREATVRDRQTVRKRLMRTPSGPRFEGCNRCFAGAIAAFFSPIVEEW